MKRSPLKRGTSQLKRTPVNKLSSRRKRESAIYARSKKQAFRKLAGDQANGYDDPVAWCERCMTTARWNEHASPATDWHHWHPVGQGGPYLGGRMICVCRPCHDWIHKHPALSRKDGWLK